MPIPPLMTVPATVTSTSAPVPTIASNSEPVELTTAFGPTYRSSFASRKIVVMPLEMLTS